MNVIPLTWAFRCKQFPDGLAEYNALAMAVREVIPLQNLSKGIIHSLRKSNVKLTTFHKILRTVVHEDNTGALKLVTMEPGWMTPRSKYYGIK
jgi:hypothetical protein